MEETVTCHTVHGGEKRVPKETMSFRPSAHGLVVHQGSVLLTVTKSTGKYMPPGGGLEIGETLEAALKREIHEECGIDVAVQRLLFFGERFFYYEPTMSAWHCHLFFFLCFPGSLILDATVNPDTRDEAMNPQWVDIATLRPEHFQIYGKEILEHLVKSVAVE